MARWICWVSRPEVTAVLILLAMALLALGTFFPQRPEEPAAVLRWEDAARARYGGLLPVLERLGLFRWYMTPAPWAALALLAVVTLLCTLNRWPALRPRLAHRSPSHWGTLLTHLAVLLLLAALAASALGWREKHTLVAGEAVTLTHRSQLSLRVDAIRVVRYPDGTPADYEAEVTFLWAGREAAQRTLRVSGPAAFGGMAFLLVGYAQREGHPVVTLLAVRDPGTALWFVGGAMLLAGLVLTLLKGR